MTELPADYDPERIERKWREEWAESDVSGAREDERPEYVIDTPPPYPTGNLHIGNALGWCYMDYAARYRRMTGHDVRFPQGWDCHGLPTEVKVEEDHGVDRTDLPREEFRELCVEHTEGRIDAMKETMERLGFSQDWSAEFRTMDPEYWGTTQRSFVEMAEEGYVYRDEHPVNWCPRCETAIADAEVEALDREGSLYAIAFPGADGEDLEIATTRPELLAACVAVAVHPDDGRYEGRAGDTVEVPLFGRAVDVIADDDVDPEFGTGAVMICTFGDKQDVDWWAEYDLDLRAAVTADGTLSDVAGEYAGLEIEEARDAVAADLASAGYLNDTEAIEQSVGACWRCDTPIEIRSTEQWFVEVDEEEILETARGVEWIPEHMYDRLEDWTTSMDWDWVISRQRVFATPIPAWFCANADCEHVHVAGPERVPVDPTEEEPTVEVCPECESGEWRGETDVMDTWMDSSITPLYLRDWPDADFEPTALREQGHDIIRTWAFYTILRTAALVEEIPWEEALINGIVLGDDGHKMSKSRDNFVQPETVVEEHSADAFRQAMALGGQPGADIQFQWKEVTAASRFLRKVWNISRFALGHVEADTPDMEAPAYRDADRWILLRCERVTESVRKHMDAHRFDAALRELREFAWHDLADDYVELVKGRLYEGRPGERDAARNALYTALTAVLRMLAPFSPFLTEEVWEALPATGGSIHAADWPSIDRRRLQGENDLAAVEAAGEVIVDVASTVRAWKSEQGMALNAELSRIEVYPHDDHEAPIDTWDLADAVAAPVYVRQGEPSVERVPVGVDVDHGTIGPQFRERAGDVVAALEAEDPADLKRQFAIDGEAELPVDGETVTVDEDAVEVVHQRRSEGEEVAVLEAETATVLVFP